MRDSTRQTKGVPQHSQICGDRVSGREGGNTKEIFWGWRGRLKDTERSIAHGPSTAAANLLLKKPRLLCIECEFASKITCL